MKLAFVSRRDPRSGEPLVIAPKVPAQAVSGVYMLFVVDKQGVPSESKQVRLEPETRGRTTPFP